MRISKPLFTGGLRRITVHLFLKSISCLFTIKPPISGHFNEKLILTCCEERGIRELSLSVGLTRSRRASDDPVFAVRHTLPSGARDIVGHTVVAAVPQQ